MKRIGVLLLCCLLPACATRSALDDVTRERDVLQGERDRLSTRVEQLQIERQSLEEQYINAQESYEDERELRETLANDLALSLIHI